MFWRSLTLLMTIGVVMRLLPKSHARQSAAERVPRYSRTEGLSDASRWAPYGIWPLSPPCKVLTPRPLAEGRFPSGEPGPNQISDEAPLAQRHYATALIPTI